MAATVPPPDGQPRTLDEAVAALATASPADLHRYADLFDAARRALADTAGAFDRVWARVEEVWAGAGAVAAAGWEVSRRTRRLLHELETVECGRQARVAADALAAGRARLDDLRATRAAASGPPERYDQEAQAVVRGLADAYREIGTGLGGERPPRVPADPVAGGSPVAAVVLAAADSDPDDLFRPVTPAGVGALRPGEPAVPPSGGGGGAGGGGMPMMPFMPMGGMGGMGGTQLETTQRRSTAGGQGDHDAWGDQNSGWQVLGRREKATARERSAAVLKELESRSKGDRDG